MITRTPQDAEYFAQGRLRCYRCDGVKPFEAFNPDKTKPTRGFRSGYCKQCRNIKYKTDAEKSAAYYIKSRPRHQEIMVQWRKNNQDKMLAYWHNYKAKLKNNGPYDKDITRLKVYERDQGFCQICHLALEYKDSSIDHRIPVSKGGTHTWDNVQIAHRICNIRKGAKL